MKVVTAVYRLLIVGVAALLMGGPDIAGAADSLSVSAVRARFARDTVYHVILNPAAGQAYVRYGDIPLVQCSLRVADPAEVRGFAGNWNERLKTGWQSVVRREVRSGGQAVNDTVIGVIAKVSSVNPDLIRRVMPRRFEVTLTQSLGLRIMTPEGAAEDRSFAERWSTWISRLNPFDHRKTLELIVSPVDAQMLYYALEPGAPVLWLNDTETKPTR
ncbi:MAG: hypothetical protein AB1792_08130 [Candidatus Zixiibacteriota bacterium]